MKYLIPIALILIPIIVHAQVGPEEGKLYALLDDIAAILRIIGISLGVIVVVISGIIYMSAGGDEIKVTKAKKTLLYGIIGTAIVFAASWILSVVEEILMRADVT